MSLTRLPALATLPSGCPIATSEISRPLGNLRTPFLPLFGDAPAFHNARSSKMSTRCLSGVFSSCVAR